VIVKEKAEIRLGKARHSATFSATNTIWNIILWFEGFILLDLQQDLLARKINV
jgi:hypothetical protein